HPDLTALPKSEIRKELQICKENLEKLIQKPVISFAYPYGYYNLRVLELTEEVGYLFGISTDTGGIHLENNRFCIFRVNIFPSDTLTQFRKKTSWWYRYLYRWKRGK
ncbi:MAG: polysaccharide deacetylase family protein, partial [Bacteroidia bacterium]|nr:polysaccharide deacetylase family protein [Bacteroidia bacterium]